MIRPDLDGLLVEDDDRLFIIIEGQRHLIAADEVRDSLFVDPKPTSMALSEIYEGHPLHKGTCLARGDDEGGIYLLSISYGVAKRRLIKDFESFKEFGFALEKVIRIPAAVIQLIPEESALTGAMARIGRW